MPTSFVYEKESVGRAFGAVFANFFLLLRMDAIPARTIVLMFSIIVESAVSSI